MLHITFNLSYSIACLCTHHPSFPYYSGIYTWDSFPLSSVKHKRQPMSFNPSSAHPIGIYTSSSSLYRLQTINSSSRTPSVVDSILTRSPYSAVGIPPSQSILFTSPLMGRTPTPKQPWTQLHCRNFPHSDARILQISLMGLPITWKQCRKLIKSLPRQTDHADDKDQHSEEAWSYQIQKANGKTSQVRSKHTFSFQTNLYKHFHFKEIYTCFIPNNPTILNTFFQNIFDYI